VATFHESTSSVIEQLRPLADGQSVIPLRKYVQLLTFDVISKVHVISPRWKFVKVAYI